MKFTKWLRYLVENADSEAIESMFNSKDIEKKKLNIGNSLTAWALNFNRDVFIKSTWNSQTTKARGLFVTLDGSEKRVLARAYDKFFNLGEIVAGKKETIDSMNLKYPVTAWHKYNGYLGIMSVAHNALNVSNILYTGIFFDTEDFNNLINTTNTKLASLKKEYEISLKAAEIGELKKEIEELENKIQACPKNIEINRDPLHVTLYYYNNDEEKHKKIDELSKIDSEINIKYTPKEIYIANNGDKKLVTLRVETKSSLKGNTTPHITLFAQGFTPKESASLIDDFSIWEKNHNAIKFEVSGTDLEGALGHYMNNKEIQKINNNNILFVASKSTNEHDFANMFFKILNTNYKNSPKKLIQLKDYLGENNYSMAFEVIEPEADAHIIKYSNAQIVLLDIIQNEINFKSIPYEKLKEKATKFKLNVKKPVKIKDDGENFKIENREELNTFIKKINDPNYKLEDENDYIEGFVFQDTKNYMFKFKSNYYNYWKKMRSVTDAMVKAKYNTEASTSIKKTIQAIFITKTKGLIESYFGAENNIPATNNEGIQKKKEILEKKKEDAINSLKVFIEKLPKEIIKSEVKNNITAEINDFITLIIKNKEKSISNIFNNNFEKVKNIKEFIEQGSSNNPEKLRIEKASEDALDKMKNLFKKANSDLFKKTKTKQEIDSDPIKDTDTKLTEPDMSEEKKFTKFLIDNPHLLEKVKIGDKLKSPSIVQLRDAYEKEKTPIKIKYNLYKVEDNAGDEGEDSENNDNAVSDNSLWENFLKSIESEKAKIPSNVHIIINRNEDAKYEDAKLIKDLNLKTKTLIIASGVMGSGKSTWIKKNLKKLSKDDLEKLSKDDLKKLKNNLKTYTVRSTDDEFTDETTGEYKWSRDGLKNAHKNNLEKAKANIDLGQNVVIDNTNLKPSEFEKYIAYAKSKGYEIIFLIFATEPKKILGTNGVNSPERKNIGKDFSKPEDLKKVYDKINSFYNGGIQQIINQAEKFK